MKLLWVTQGPTKFGPDRFSRFDVYWIQKTDLEAKYIDRYIDVNFLQFFKAFLQIQFDFDK